MILYSRAYSNYTVFSDIYKLDEKNNNFYFNFKERYFLILKYSRSITQFEKLFLDLNNIKLYVYVLKNKRLKIIKEELYNLLLNDIVFIKAVNANNDDFCYFYFKNKKLHNTESHAMTIHSKYKTIDTYYYLNNIYYEEKAFLKETLKYRRLNKLNKLKIYE